MPTRQPQNPFSDPLQSSAGPSRSGIASSPSTGRPAHLRQRSLTARGGEHDLGHSMNPQAGPGAFLMREDDAASSRATSLYGDHEASSSSHLPFAGSTTYLNSESKYSLSQDVGVYSSPRKEGRFVKEDDDYLHEQGSEALPREGRARYLTETAAFRGSNFAKGRFCNVFALAFIGTALLGVFLAFPIATFWKSGGPIKPTATAFGDEGAGVIVANAPMISKRTGPVDPDTPRSAFTKRDYEGREMKLVFSDEFNQDGRYFYPGEDPYWEAQDFHYWGTNNLEWADPDAISTSGGHLNIVLSKESLAESHNLGYVGGMLNSWNKMCYTGGRIEVSISLPGSTRVQGLWPAAWMMGNLGRAGYGGTLDGTWPYTYDTCDIGTLMNQTDPVTQQPVIPRGGGDQYRRNSISYLPGQKLSRCTCPGEDHPGPFENGEFKGRGASEIDIFEALVLPAQNRGEVSMSGQWAPFDLGYEYDNSTTEQAEFFENDFETFKNTYLGSAYQQVTSGLSYTNSSTYDSTTNFAMYGVEHTPSDWNGFGTGSINWIQENQRQWRLGDTAMKANPRMMIGNRPVSGEPMYILLNLFMSEAFGAVDLENLEFPATMRVDWVRVYQLPEHENIGCSPPGYETADYINRHPEIYYNANITTVEQYKNGTFPKNRLIDTC